MQHIQPIYGEVSKTTKRVFSFSQENGKLVFVDFFPEGETSETNLLHAVLNDPHYLEMGTFDSAQKQLKSHSVPYVVIRAEKGYFLVWFDAHEKLCSRHFDLVKGNTAIKNESAPLYKEWDGFKEISFKRSQTYVMA